MPAMELWLDVLIQWIHCWRMPVFFLLAGFFAALIVNKKGSRYFAIDRLIRLAPCLVIFSSLVNLLDGHYSGKLEYTWFLYYLLIISLSFSILYRPNLVRTKFIFK
ncbi:hypothetical protein DBZ36_16535 [Alginatibacterium sediminis]|uniref:Acyltransferase 3 domain-containing protein n=1 Tax=Alginatibacterium sediminis TaxID=2164068 RepID=A0A420E6W4_9ALTE|nr:hypothetical protein DBZ36_16535 [Alginatibacterium sediminis]